MLWSHLSDETREMLTKKFTFLDQVLAKKGIALISRPIHATLLFIEHCVVSEQPAKDNEYVFPQKTEDIIKSTPFKMLFKMATQWYYDCYGESIREGRSDYINAVVLIRNTPYLLKIPMTKVEPEVQGESSWLCFLNSVEPSEDVIKWIQNSPNIDRLERREIEKTLSISTNIANKIRSAYYSILCLESTTAQVHELSGNIMPNLESAAHRIAMNTGNNLKIAYWDIQMASELALKCLSLQRSNHLMRLMISTSYMTRCQEHHQHLSGMF